MPGSWKKDEILKFTEKDIRQFEIQSECLASLIGTLLKNNHRSVEENKQVSDLMIKHCELLCNLGYYYSRDYHQYLNYNKAIEFFEAAEVNYDDAYATLKLGEYYFKGRGYDQDGKRALEKFQTAFSSELPQNAYLKHEAAYRIAQCFERGMGTPDATISITEALKWYKIAKQLGSTIADAAILHLNEILRQISQNGGKAANGSPVRQAGDKAANVSPSRQAAVKPSHPAANGSPVRQAGDKASNAAANGSPVRQAAVKASNAAANGSPSRQAGDKASNAVANGSPVRQAAVKASNAAANGVPPRTSRTSPDSLPPVLTLESATGPAIDNKGASDKFVPIVFHQSMQLSAIQENQEEVNRPATARKTSCKLPQIVDFFDATSQEADSDDESNLITPRTHRPGTHRPASSNAASRTAHADVRNVGGGTGVDTGAGTGTSTDSGANGVVPNNASGKSQLPCRLPSVFRTGQR